MLSVDDLLSTFIFLKTGNARLFPVILFAINLPVMVMIAMKHFKSVSSVGLLVSTSCPAAVCVLLLIATFFAKNLNRLEKMLPFVFTAVFGISVLLFILAIWKILKNEWWIEGTAFSIFVFANIIWVLFMGFGLAGFAEL